MRKLNLTITRANIDNGEKANPGKCPIANSIIESVRGVFHVSVLPTEATIKIKKGKSVTAYKSKLPKNAFTFVKKFDDGAKVRPIKLTLSLNKLDKDIAELV